MRSTTERIQPLNAQAPSAPRVNEAVAANPVGGLGAPAPYDPSQALAHSLSALVPALGNLAEANDRMAAKGDKEEAERQMLLGARDRLSQEGNEPVAMLPEQNPYWQQGYMQQHGKVIGQQASTELAKQFAEESRKPGFDPQKFMQDFRRDQLQGMNDPDVLRGMLPELASTSAQMEQAWAKQQVHQTRLGQVEALTTAADGFVASLKGIDPVADPADRQLQYKALVADQVHTNSMTPREVGRSVALAMADDPTLRPEDFDWVDIPDENGVSLSMAVGPDGVSNGDILRKARAQAVVRQQKEIEAEVKERTYAQAAAFGERLENDPLSLGDPYQFVTSNRALFGDKGKAESAVQEIIKKQQAAREANDKLALWRQHGALLPRAFLEDPDVKKLIEKENQKLWLAADSSNPESMGKLATDLLRRYEAGGALDSRFESLVKNIGTSGIQRDAKGNPTGEITTEFRVAYETFRAIKNSKNPQLLDKMSPEGRALMQVFHDNIRSMPEKDAFNLAKMVASPEAQSRIKLAFPDLTAEKNAILEEQKYLTSNLSFNGNGFFISATNAAEVGRQTVELAKQKLAFGAISTEQALRIAREEMQETSVYDGVGGIARIPIGANKEHAREGLKLFVEATKARWEKENGQPLAGYAVQTSSTGPDMVYTIVDPIGNAIATKPYVDLHQDWLRSRNADVGSIVSTQNLKQGFAAGSITPEQVTANWPAIQNAFASGALDAKTYSRAAAVNRNAALAAQVEGVKAKSAAAKFAAPQDPTLFDGTKDLHLGAPIHNPKGANLSTKAYALQYASTNPDFALTAFGEGLRLQTYSDPAGKRTIGLGYNIDARSSAEVVKDFTAAGIAGDRIQRVVSGEEQITPQEAVRLYDVVKKTYVGRAQKHFGPEWDTMPANVKAVMTDIAYNGGVHNFPKIVDDIAAGRYADAASKLSVTYWDEKADKRVYNTRRVNLWRAMLAGPEVFTEMVKRA